MPIHTDQFNNIRREYVVKHNICLPGLSRRKTSSTCIYS